MISKESEPFIIAEVGVNHNGDYDIAKQLIDIAHKVGADAVKFQSFYAQDLVLESVEKVSYQKAHTDPSTSQYDMIKSLEIGQQELFKLYDYTISKGLIFLTTPFSENVLKDLDSMSLPAYKVSSTDLTNIPFLIEIAKRKKPILLSTGMSYLSEVESALRAISKYNDDVILFHCTSSYPTPPDAVNLDVLKRYASEFDIILGYSDHTEGVGASPYAVSIGAQVIEKHITLDKNAEGPDHKASLSPEEFKKLVEAVRTAFCYRGSNIKIPLSCEVESRERAQKNFVARIPILKGDVLSSENIVAKRTGGSGVSPLYYESIFGSKAVKDFETNEPITI